MRKVAVYVPSFKDQILASYPFFHFLNQEFPDTEVNVLTSKENEKYFCFLDCKLRTHCFDPQEESIPGLFRYIHNNQSIGDIDCYIDLAQNLKSSLVGIFLKAKERVGVKKGLNQFFYSKKILPFLEKSPEKTFVRILENYVGQKKDDLFIEKIIGDIDFLRSPLITNNLISGDFVKGYFLVVIDDLGEISYLEDERKDTPKEHFWRAFFEAFKGERFIVFSEKLDTVLNDFLKSLTPRNEYFYQKGDNLETLSELLKYSNALFTDSSQMASIGPYFLKPTFLMGVESYELPISNYLKGRPCVISKNNEDYDILFSNQKKSVASINEVSEFIQDILKI